VQGSEGIDVEQPVRVPVRVGGRVPVSALAACSADFTAAGDAPSWVDDIQGGSAGHALCEESANDLDETSEGS